MFTKSSIKIVSIGTLILVLSIPLLFIYFLMAEREGRYRSTVFEVASKWGKSQSVTGVVLSVPYKKIIYTSDNRKSVGNGTILVFPDKLNMKVNLSPDTRSRGIYKVVVYEMNIDVYGSLTVPNLAKSLAISSDVINWDSAKLIFALTDTRGINQTVKLNLNGQSIDFVPGTASDIVANGLHAPIEQGIGVDKKLEFSFNLKVNGSQSVSFLPVAKSTSVELMANWPDPSFNGNFLPTYKNISKDSFAAKWEVSHYERNLNQVTADSSIDYFNTNFGVELFQPVGFYQKSIRSIKYGILFLVITFMCFFFFEVFNRSIKVHPMQYLLIGFAISVFYLLLISFSEYIGFNFAYLISTVALVGLITSYSAFVLQHRKRSLIVGGILLFLYIYLFVLLQLEDLALLIGSIFCFLLLSTVMFITRKIDWYGLDESRDSLD